MSQYQLSHTASAFNSFAVCYTYKPTVPTADILSFLTGLGHSICRLLALEMLLKGQLKFFATLKVQYFDRNNERLTNVPHFAARQKICANSSDLKGLVEATLQEIFAHSEHLEQQGSSLVVDCIENLDIHTVKYEPLKGSTFVELPANIRANKAVINPQNQDQECFKWSILAALHPAARHAERIQQYRQHENDLDFSNISFPVKIDDVKTFEMQNNISVNIYSYEDGGGYAPLYFSKIANGMGRIKLLYYHGHYCWIKSFDRLLFHQNKAKRRGYFCPKCLFAMYSKERLAKHMEDCRNDQLCRVEMPAGDEPVLKFQNYHKVLRRPIVIYGDFECFTRKMQGCDPNDNQPFVDKYQLHDPYSYGCVVSRSCCSGVTYDEPIIYRGDDPVKEFIRTVVDVAHNYHDDMNQPMQMNADDVTAFSAAKLCGLCQLELGNDRVRDHCHLCGKFRAALHNSCNQKLRLSKDVTAVFHNLRRYDGHLIMQHIGEFCESEGFELECIAKTMEDYITFSMRKKRERWQIRFIDSCQFLASSLENLVKLVPEADFHAMKKFIRAEHFNLLLRKGVFPYDYIDDWTKLDERVLPPVEEFYSKLNEEGISREDYEHAQKVMNDLNLKDLGEYSDVYLKCDVLLLADVFENFRNFGIKTYGLDPCHYCTISAFGFDACLKQTNVELELLTDPDIYSFLERGIRGGISYIGARYAAANNPYLPETYDPLLPEMYIIYWDGKLVLFYPDYFKPSRNSCFS